MTGAIDGGWNSSDVRTGVVALSNGDRTATCVTWPMTITATNGQSTGKRFLSFTIGQTGANMFGLLRADLSASIDQNPPDNAIQIGTSGLYRWAGASVGGPGCAAMVAGSICDLAIDLDAKLFWARADNKLWNRKPLTTANPATGIGGYDLSPWVSGSPLFLPFLYLEADGNFITLNTGTEAFTYPPPVGFSSWYAPPPPSLPVQGGVFSLQAGDAAIGKGYQLRCDGASLALYGAKSARLLSRIFTPVSGGWSGNGGNCTLSDNNRKVVVTEAPACISGVDSCPATGKWFLSFHSESGMICGLRWLTSDYDPDNLTPGSAFWIDSGAGYFVSWTGIASRPIAVASLGTVDIALDAASRTFWFRVDGGLWNNDVNADPATGVGGVPWSTRVVAKPFLPFFLADTVGASATINTGTVPFSYPPPVGFSNWYGVAAPALKVVAEGGAFALAAVGVGTLKRNRLVCDGQSFAVTGVAVSLRQYKMPCSTGAIALHGVNAARSMRRLAAVGHVSVVVSSTSRRLSCCAARGTFGVVGYDVVFRIARNHVNHSEVGAFAINGGSIPRSLSRVASCGAFNIAGLNTRLSLRLSCETASFHCGVRPLVAHLRIAADSGSIDLIGSPQAGVSHHRIAAFGGAYLLFGGATARRLRKSLDDGGFTVVAGNIAIRRSSVASIASYGLIGNPVSLTKVSVYSLVCQTGVIAATGLVAVLGMHRVISGGGRAGGVTGQSVSWRVGRGLVCDHAHYSVAGNTTVRALSLSLGAGAFVTGTSGLSARYMARLAAQSRVFRLDSGASDFYKIGFRYHFAVDAAEFQVLGSRLAGHLFHLRFARVVKGSQTGATIVGGRDNAVIRGRVMSNSIRGMSS